MKRIIYIITAVVMLAGLGGCNNPSELPPLDTNYDRYFVLPEPEVLNMEERAYIDQQRQEYNEAIKKQ